MPSSDITAVAESIEWDEDFRITRDQALALVPDSPDRAMDLLIHADRIRRRFKPRRIFTCGIVNAKSGRCAEDCAFCAQSAHHRSRIDVYPLRGTAELIESGIRLAQAGADRYSVVTSGTALSPSEIENVCRTAETLRGKTNLKLCASLGLLTESMARSLKAAGIDRYHHNIETARSHFARICTTHDFEEDLDTIRAAKAAGLEVCSGGIFGMGETWAQRVEMAFILQELEVDAIPVNFLNPIPGTRLGDRNVMAPLDALACIALMRFVHPRRDITICGGREITLKDLQSWVFFAGANGLMIGNYLTTRGRSIAADLEMIADLGFIAGREESQP